MTSSLSNVSPSGVFHWTFLMGSVLDKSQLNFSFFFHFSCILLYHHYPMGNWDLTCTFLSIENHFLPIVCIYQYRFPQYSTFFGKRKEQKRFNKVSTGGATVTTSLAPRLQLFAKTLLGVIELVPMKQPLPLSDSIGKEIFLTLTHILQVLQVIHLHPMI